MESERRCRECGKAIPPDAGQDFCPHCLLALALVDRKWALTVLEQARKRLREEYRSVGKEQLYEVLQRGLSGAQEELCYAEAAKALGKSEESLRMEVYRLRKRFRVLLLGGGHTGYQTRRDR